MPVDIIQPVNVSHNTSSIRPTFFRAIESLAIAWAVVLMFSVCLRAQPIEVNVTTTTSIIITKSELIQTVENLVLPYAKRQTPSLDNMPAPPEDLTILERTIKQKGTACVYYCFCANFTAAPYEYQEGVSWEKNAANNQFGCFLISKHKPTKMICLGFFPTRRWGDYEAVCGPIKGNTVTIYSYGINYKDEGQEIHYKVNFETNISSEVFRAEYTPETEGGHL